MTLGIVLLYVRKSFFSSYERGTPAVYQPVHVSGEPIHPGVRIRVQCLGFEGLGLGFRVQGLKFTGAPRPQKKPTPWNSPRTLGTGLR